MKLATSRLVLLLASLPLLSACKNGGDISDVYSPKEWRQMFEEAGGWVPLPFPESKYRPGSIIKVDDEGIRWIDHLDSCGYPPEAIEVEVGHIPTITFTRDRRLDASALINIEGVQAGPEFSKVAKTHLSIQEHSADAIRMIKLKIWMEEPANRDSVSQACMQELLKPDRYLVTEAFRVSKGTYTLYDQSGAAIKLDAPLLSSMLKFQPDVKYEVTSEGSLVIEQPVYFAVRRAIRAGSDWETLGSEDAEPESADALIGELFLEESGQ